jgi:hypothetical protein
MLFLAGGETFSNTLREDETGRWWSMHMGAVVWLCGCVVVWLYGCMAVWLYGCVRMVAKVCCLVALVAQEKEIEKMDNKYRTYECNE